VRLLRLPLASLLLAGCTQVNTVKGPDGRDALLIDCPSELECVQKAGEMCPAGYNIHTSSTSLHAGGPYSVSSRNQILVTCNPGGVVVPPEPEPEPVSAPPQPRAVASPSPAAPAARQDSRACEAAYKHLEQLSQWWVKSTPGAAPAAQLPRRHPFVSLCRSLPEQVQRCMHGAYLAANEQHCAEQFKRLETPKKDRIDALFLE